jgi:hypothetical protein
LIREGTKVAVLKSPTSLQLDDQDMAFSINLPNPMKSSIVRSLRFSDIDTLEDLEKLKAIMRQSGIDGMGVDVIFDIGGDEQVKGVELII